MKTMGPTPRIDDLDFEEESLYRRPVKSIVVRRRRIRFRLGALLKWLLLGAVGLVPLGFGAARLTSYGLTSPRFQMSAPEDIDIRGIHFASKQDILSGLGMADWNSGGGRNAFRVSLGQEMKQVESIPWVRSATVTRAFPNRLAVTIIERNPIAFVNVGGRIKLIDADGVMLDNPVAGQFTFPVLDGLDAQGSSADRRPRVQLYVDFKKQVEADAAAAGWLISEVDLSEADDLTAVLVQGRESILAHFGHMDFKERFGEFLSMLPELGRSNTPIDSVDLRFLNQVVVNPKKAVTSDK